MQKKKWGVLNPDGSLNIVRKGFRPALFSDTYHHLLAMPWPFFFAFIVSLYVVLNLIFACIYFFCGKGALQGLEGSQVPFFWDCFFFSVQTIATIGYGHVHPVGVITNLVVTIESFIGILELAMVTGLFFSRLSKPTVKVAFSNVALMAQENGRQILMFRIANKRKSQITEATVNMALLKTEASDDGEQYRRLYDLKLQRSFSPMFALSWTIIHPIDESSPLFGAGPEKLEEIEAEFIVTLTGRDEVYAQSVHARHAYRLQDIVWNGRFKDILIRTPTHVEMDLNQMHTIIN